METEIDNKQRSVVYGHIHPSYLPPVGTVFKKGEPIAVLGAGYTNETDNERKHLHFGILSNDRIDLRGYVQTKQDLSGWVNPTQIFKE